MSHALFWKDDKVGVVIVVKYSANVTLYKIMLNLLLSSDLIPHNHISHLTFNICKWQRIPYAII
jgi:hypothetical protein